MDLNPVRAKARRETEKDLKIARVAGVVKKTWNLGSEPKAQVSVAFYGDPRFLGAVAAYAWPRVAAR